MHRPRCVFLYLFFVFFDTNYCIYRLYIYKIHDRHVVQALGELSLLFFFIFFDTKFFCIYMLCIYKICNREGHR